MKHLDRSIKRLKTIISDPHCKKMNLSNIKGYLGELFVAQKLISEGLKIEMRGNQSGYDIEVPKFKIAIDVKFSTIKSEVKNCPNYWGWALKHKNKVKPISCTHFICVAVDEELNPFKYYILTANNLNKFPQSAIGQFKNVERGCVLLKDYNELDAIKEINLRNYFTANKKLLVKGTLIEVGLSQKLSDEL
jgi:hypothetical protein